MAPKRLAERFEMELPVWYHVATSDRWEQTTTVNVSRNGVLARASSDQAVPSGEVDFVMALPPCGIVKLARIRCAGRFVRVCSADESTAFALSIDRYRFVKAGEPEEPREDAPR